tara:strand:- start:944 stop:1597 length:654 start_codon:yes stop_codon:yes gene_type:complete
MKKKKIQISIDSPAASGAGTQAKLISKKYNLLYLDSGKLYRILGKEYLKNGNKINYKLFKKKILKTKPKHLKNKKLLTNEIGLAAAKLAKIKKIRIFVSDYQKKLAKKIPRNFNGICIDGRDIGYNIMPNADIKFFFNAKLSVRAKRRYNELKKLGHKTKFKDLLNSIKKRDKSDYERKISPLKKTDDSILIDTSNLTINRCFLKIKKIIDKKLKLT